MDGLLGIVCYDSGFYHPKTYHFHRNDGSQTAFVGSVNLGLPGVGGKHIEAGLIVDTRDGDSADVLDSIAAAVDVWFAADPRREGFDPVEAMADVDRLIADRVLLAEALPRRPRARRSGGTGTVAAPRPRLTALITIPQLPTRPTPGAALTPVTPPPPVPVPAPVPIPAVLPQFVALQQYYPAPFVIDWSIVGPTRDTAALTSTTLPQNVAGLVIRLKKPIIKKILGKGGTPSITIPMETVPTLRFAVARGTVHLKPQARYDVLLRHIGGASSVIEPPAKTNVIPYGYLPGETSHKETRLRIPTKVLARFVDRMNQAGVTIPSIGDPALLEWPTAARPDFRITFMEPQSQLDQGAQQLVNAAAGQLIGGSACWLPLGFAPTW